MRVYFIAHCLRVTHAAASASLTCLDAFQQLEGGDTVIRALHQARVICDLVHTLTSAESRDSRASSVTRSVVSASPRGVLAARASIDSGVVVPQEVCGQVLDDIYDAFSVLQVRLFSFCRFTTESTGLSEEQFAMRAAVGSHVLTAMFSEFYPDSPPTLPEGSLE